MRSLYHCYFNAYLSFILVILRHLRVIYACNIKLRILYPCYIKAPVSSISLLYWGSWESYMLVILSWESYILVISSWESYILVILSWESYILVILSWEFYILFILRPQRVLYPWMSGSSGKLSWLWTRRGLWISWSRSMWIRCRRRNIRF